MSPVRLYFRVLTAACTLLCAGLPMPASAQQTQTSGAALQLHDALILAQRGDVNGALNLTHALLLKYPDYAAGYKLQGSLQEDSGHPAEAEKSYESALELTADDPELLYKVGLSSLVAGKAEAAIGLFTRQLKAQPDDGDGWFYLAQAYHLHGQDDQALVAIEKSVTLQPDSAPVLQKYGELLSSSGNSSAAMPWLLKALRIDPTLSRIQFDLGSASLKNQDIDSAAQYAGKAVAEQPSDLKAVALLAQVDVKLAQWDSAKTLLTQILATHPEDAASRLELGHAELALKQYGPAKVTLEQIIQQDPTTILAHFYLARVYAGLGDKAAAQHEAELHAHLVEQAGSVVPADELTYEKATLLEARELLVAGKESQALQLFAGRAKGPTATKGAPYMLVGVSYLYMGRPADADRMLQKALLIEPAVRDAHTYLGLLALQANDLLKAEAEFNAELAKDPNSQLAVAELGEVRYRQQHWAEAAAQLEKSRTATPALLYMLSDCYFHLDRVKDANVTAELAADYARDDPSMVQRIIDLLVSHQQTELAQQLKVHTPAATQP